MALWNQIYITLSTNSKVSAIYTLNIWLLAVYTPGADAGGVKPGVSKPE